MHTGWHRSWRSRAVLRGLVVPAALVGCDTVADLPRRTDDSALTYLAATPPDSMHFSGGTVVSPTARLSARIDSTGESESRVVLLRAGEDRAQPIVTIGEADPGSGISYRYAWTADGAALLIWGSGTLSGQPPRELCLVYRVKEGDLIEPRECPVGNP